MRSNQHTIETDASKQAIWKVWRDVANWPSWDEAVQWCKLDGEFKAGTILHTQADRWPGRQSRHQRVRTVSAFHRCFFAASGEDGIRP